MSNYIAPIQHDELDRMKEILLGRRIVEASGQNLTLDDGTILQIVPNEGGCICGAGDYELRSITKFDNVITSVEVRSLADEGGQTYQLFVYSGGISTSVAQIVGDDGNGYYGTGFEIYVTKVGQQK